MRKVVIMIFWVAAFATALWGDDVLELKILQGELSQIQTAERAIEDAAKGDSPADAMLKLINDESLVRLYEKWAGENWGAFASMIGKEILVVNRQYKIPKHSPGSAEVMLEILEPNIEELKKKYVTLSKDDRGMVELKKQLDGLKKKVEELRKQADEEKIAEKERIANAVSARQEAFRSVSRKVIKKLQSKAEQPLASKIESVRNGIVKRETSKVRVEGDCEERTRVADRKTQDDDEKKVDLLIAAQLAKLKNRYVETKKWYTDNLRYNDLSEPIFGLFGEGDKGFGCVFFKQVGDEVDTERKIKVDYIDGELTYSSSVVSGYAMELLTAAVLTFVYEHPDYRHTNWDSVRELLGDDFGELGNLMKLKRQYYCLECDGLAYVDKEFRCRDCAGRGAGTCPRCKNSGWIQCTSCKVPGKSFVFKKGCTMCNGSHRIECPACYGGRHPEMAAHYCKKCGGDGKIKVRKVCPICNGSGKKQF